MVFINSVETDNSPDAARSFIMPDGVSGNPRSFLTRLSFFEPLALYWEQLVKMGFTAEAEQCREKYWLATKVSPSDRSEVKNRVLAILGRAA